MTIHPEPHLPVQGLDFDRGNADYLSLTNANFAYSRTKFAISMWFKRENTTASNFALYTKWTSGAVGANHEFRLRIVSDHRLELQVVRKLTSIPVTYASDTVKWSTQNNNTNWNHILVTCDPGQVFSANRYKAWLNGSAESVNTSSFGSGQGIPPTAATTPVKIGAQNPNIYWNGQMYQVAFFSGGLPVIGDVYDATQSWPKDIRTVANLFSIADGDLGQATNDFLLTNWTNNNTVTVTTEIPAT
jgi:hypothetical protein